MESSTTIKDMLAGNKIFIPNYQRAYSWDIELENNKAPKQINTFLTDLEEYNQSSTKSKYYFGHFLFEEKSEKVFGVIDGQQRLTTIIIFLSALFSRLKNIRELTEYEEEIFEDIIKRKSTYRFETVVYDNQLFKDYVIDQTKKDRNGLETESAKRIVNTFDFFSKILKTKEEKYLLKMLDTIQDSSCSTHHVKDESEAIQMFIFQNNRGKKPSNLEIIKAQFMFYTHLHGGEEKESLINEIKSRFEKIYKSISSIEYNINEDDVLLYTLKVHFNSLYKSNATNEIDKLLSEDGAIEFIRSFTHSLSTSFEYLSIFFGEDERNLFNIHSLISLGKITIAIPFIIKAYKFNLSKDKLSELCSILESLVLRHKLIGTRADITSRLNDKYKEFTEENPKIKPIKKHIKWMKNVDSSSWWAYWNNEELEKSLQGNINHSTAKFLLWKYENELESKGKNGYSQTRFDKIISPELEHIAPKTENPKAGYDSYDEEFKEKFLDSIGNYLLLSKSHNCSIGNKPFKEKRLSFTHLKQQLEIQEMTKDKEEWTKEHIKTRQEKIIKLIIEKY